MPMITEINVNKSVSLSPKIGEAIDCLVVRNLSEKERESFREESRSISHDSYIID